MKQVLAFAKQIIREALGPSDWAVDGTVGNGYDTAFLAECVGSTGRVYGFDIQAKALRTAHLRLKAQNLHDRVSLLEAGHEQMASLLPAEARGRIKAAMFNLGYLPGGDHTLSTRLFTTRQALESTLNLLCPGGRITVVLYPGHPGGQEECEGITAWAKAQDQRGTEILRYEFINQQNCPPRLLVLEKRRS